MAEAITHMSTEITLAPAPENLRLGRQIARTYAHFRYRLQHFAALDAILFAKPPRQRALAS